MKLSDYFRMSTHWKFFYDYNSAKWRVFDGANFWSGPGWQRIFTNRVMSDNVNGVFDWANPVDNWRVDIDTNTGECWIVVFGLNEQNDPSANGGCYFPAEDVYVGKIYPPNWARSQPNDPRMPEVIMGPWMVVWAGSYTLSTYCLVGGAWQWQTHIFDDCIALVNFGAVVKADPATDPANTGISPLCDYVLLGRKQGRPMGPVYYLGWRRRNMYGGYVLMTQVNIECSSI